MIGLDTNVLIRYLTEDDPHQTEKAAALIEARSPDDPGFISLAALTEVSWVLQRSYRFDRKAIAAAIAALLYAQEVVIERAEAVREALRFFEESRAGFSDCLIAQLGQLAGCEYTVTFDRAAAKLPGMKLLA